MRRNLRANKMNKYLKRAETAFWSIAWKFKHSKTVEELVNSHFNQWSEPDHQNRLGLALALKSLSGKQAIIIETGTSAYGTDSSRLFDSYVRRFGGNFYSVDINRYPSQRLRFAKSRKSHFFVMDSVLFLKNLTQLSGEEFADLIYLDSWDVDWSHPLASAEHGEKEIVAARPFLRKGTIIVIDDTPSSMDWIPDGEQSVATLFRSEFGMLPGKGAFFKRALIGVDFSILYHDYNLVLRINDPNI